MGYVYALEKSPWISMDIAAVKLLFVLSAVELGFMNVLDAQKVIIQHLKVNANKKHKNEDFLFYRIEKKFKYQNVVLDAPIA